MSLNFNRITLKGTVYVIVRDHMSADAARRKALATGFQWGQSPNGGFMVICPTDRITGIPIEPPAKRQGTAS